MTSPGPEPGRWLSTLHHDLRTPVNHILGYSELLGEELADRGIEPPADLEKISSAARKLLEILETGLVPDVGNGEARSTAPAVVAPASRNEPGKASVCGKILVVDDDPSNRETLCRRLTREGHECREAGEGGEALEILKSQPDFDLVLLDLLMPGVDGWTMLTQLKADPELRHLPVIMISALDELESVIRCIEAGAEDYLPKPCEATLLRARIGASIEKKVLRDQERRHLHTIEETQKRLGEELAEASRYVASMLPEPVLEPVSISWAFETSTELGGDAFGYHWIDESHFAMYLLDVCGHGVGAALLSVAAINVLRSNALPGADFLSPSSVLRTLNDTFPMERNNNMYFTIWYGVYNTMTRELRHAAGGHPPALLLAPGCSAVELHAPGRIVGVFPGGVFPESAQQIPPGSRMLIFSDGAYELRTGTQVLGMEEFTTWVESARQRPDLPAATVEHARTLTGRSELDDDLSILCVDFPGGGQP